MRNYYFLEYGSDKCLTVVENDLRERYALEFDKHGDSIVGDCIHYSGNHADQMLIKENFFGKEWQYPDHKEYETIVAISFIEGKNKNKVNKCNNIKAWFEQLDHLHLLKEETIEN